MNTQEIVKELAPKLGLTQVKTAEQVMITLDTITECALREGKVVIGGHKFTKKISPARECRDPRNGNKILVEAKEKIKYDKVGK
jgi:nucleoid DNA-binding protein